MRPPLARRATRAIAATAATNQPATRRTSTSMRRPRGPRRPGPPWMKSTIRPAMTAWATPPIRNSARTTIRITARIISTALSSPAPRWRGVAGGAALAQLASPEHRPDLLDHPVAGRVHLLVQEGREVRVADDPLDLVPDLEPGVRL